MALTFPVDISTFFDTLKIAQMTFDAPEQVQVARTAGGEILPASVGPRLWTGQVSLWQQRHGIVAPTLALISALRDSAASFMIYDVSTPAPQADPTGAILAGSTVTIWSLPADARELRLAGLPISYVLTAGDYLSFSYGTNPVRQALHRVVAGTISDGLGRTPVFEVTPPLRPGAAVSAVVTLIKPVCKARIEPGSVDPGVKGQIMTTGISFRFIQTLR